MTPHRDAIRLGVSIGAVLRLLPAQLPARLVAQGASATTTGLVDPAAMVELMVKTKEVSED